MKMKLTKVYITYTLYINIIHRMTEKYDASTSRNLATVSNPEAFSCVGVVSESEIE